MQLHSAGCLTGVGLIVGIVLLFIAPPIGIGFFIVCFVIDMITAGLEAFGKGTKEYHETKNAIQQSEVNNLIEYTCPTCQATGYTTSQDSFTCDNCNASLRFE